MSGTGIRFPGEIPAGKGAVRYQAALTCGHTTTKPPIANRANGKGWFWCPDGCGLVAETRRL